MKKYFQLRENKVLGIVLAVMALISNSVFAQDSDIQISLNYPAYGVKIKNNFPNGSGKFARAFTLSNQDGSNDFFGLGAYGEINNGISTLDFGYIGSGYANPSMVFLPSGNIGIGTLTPREKLSVNGKVRAHEIKVETANWPDYVFANTYEKMPLSDLEKFIKAYKHLPEMPTATEAERDGIDLGRISKGLVKQQEELVLHLIEKDQEIQKLKTENLEIKAQLYRILKSLKLE